MTQHGAAPAPTALTLPALRTCAETLPPSHIIAVTLANITITAMNILTKCCSGFIELGTSSAIHQRDLKDTGFNDLDRNISHSALGYSIFRPRYETVSYSLMAEPPDETEQREDIELVDIVTEPNTGRILLGSWRNATKIDNDQDQNFGLVAVVVGIKAIK
ncbi:hypothetical protein J6590_047748 [Homalodisca vitripennis]|nr:hypothetical protein J6590_047748 [Homalodisca vitripennis]